MLARKLVAEALGTAFLLLAVVGSGLMVDQIAPAPAAAALLANALATAIALYVLITVLGTVSGGHLNPIVTLAFAMRGDIPPQQALAYLPAQCLGAICGTLLAHAIFAVPLWQLSTSAHAGPAQWTSEFIASFGLILVILGGINARANVAALVGAYIGGAIWFTSSSGFSNPAGVLARALTDSYTGIRPADIPAFWIAETLGALAAFGLARWLFSRAG